MNLNDERQPAGLQNYIDGYANVEAKKWLTQALDTLLNAGTISHQAAAYLINKQVAIEITTFSWWQQGMGIRWSAKGGIEMRADKVSWHDPVRKRQLSGLVHEVKHLKQGKRIALSQLGEVQAWFTEYEAGRELGLRMVNIPQEVVTWGVNPTKENFTNAGKAIIERQSRRYLFWLLPKYPFLASYDSNLAKLP